MVRTRPSQWIGSEFRVLETFGGPDKKVLFRGREVFLLGERAGSDALPDVKVEEPRPILVGNVCVVGPMETEPMRPRRMWTLACKSHGKCLEKPERGWKSHRATQYRA